MGFHLRKSFKCGPLRFNLSNSGIGVSAGVKGLRVGIDGKGRSYVGGGVGMLRYREYLGKGKSEIIPQSKNALSDYKMQPLGWLVSLLLLPFMCVAIFAYFVFSVTLVEINGLLMLLAWGIGICLLVLFFMYYNKPLGFIDIKKGIKLYQNGDYNEAAITFSNAYHSILKSPFYEMGFTLRDFISEYAYKSYINAENYQKAADFVKGHYINNSNEKLVVCYYKMENWEELINHIQTAYSAEEKEEHPVIFAMLGTAFLKLGKTEIALETLLSGPIRKRNMDQEMCAFRYALGECYEANGDIKNALKQYQKIYSFDINYEDVAQKIELLSRKEVE